MRAQSFHRLLLCAVSNGEGQPYRIQTKKFMSYKLRLRSSRVTLIVDLLNILEGVDKKKMETGVMDPRGCYHGNEDSPTRVTRDIYGLSRGGVRQYELWRVTVFVCIFCYGSRGKKTPISQPIITLERITCSRNIITKMRYPPIGGVIVLEKIKLRVIIIIIIIMLLLLLLLLLLRIIIIIIKNNNNN